MDATDLDQRTPLFYASIKNYTNVFNMLLHKITQPYQLKTVDRFGKCLLQYAAINKNVDIIKMILHKIDKLCETQNSSNENSQKGEENSLFLLNEITDEQHNRGSKKDSPFKLEANGNPSFEDCEKWNLKERRSFIREFLLHCYSLCCI